MNFKDLREADLSKAQIKKVHDKADDLPKSDFIKRYGKEGDAVRFATATKQVKKELGIDEGLLQKFNSLFPHVPVIGKPLPSKDSYGRKDVKTIQLPVGSFKGKKEELDKEDEKSVGRVVKGLKKAVKAHQGQVDALTKDIKDETELDEVDAPVARAKTALDVAVAKKSVKTAAAVKQKTKDKADVQRLLDRQKRLRVVARRNEEVVTEAVSDAYVKQIARMTDNNDHFGARIELARMMRDKELMQMYDSLEKMHRMNLGGNDALTLRSKLDKNLKFRLTQKVKKDADRLMGAL